MSENSAKAKNASTPSTTPVPRRDTQPISRGDTTEIERPEIRSTANINPPDLEEIASASPPPAGQMLRRRGRGKGQNKLLTIAAAVGAVLVLAIVAAIAIFTSPPAAAPIAQPVRPPVAPIPAKKEDPRAKAEQEWANAYRQAELVKLEIAANKVLVSRLTIAVKESTVRHVADARRELEAARAKGVELVDLEKHWRAEYVRLAKELGK